MPLYLFSFSMPELKRLPAPEREEIVEAAVFGMPVTVRGLPAFAGRVLPLTGLSFALSLVLGHWVAYDYLPVGCLAIPAVFLNLAQGRIRDLVRARKAQRPETSTGVTR